MRAQARPVDEDWSPMELAFVISAIRRYWWVIVLGTFLGLIPGLLTRSELPPDYESRAVLLVVPSSTATGSSAGTDPDRYVAGQLSVLRSEALAEQVAASLDDEFDAAVVSNHVTVGLEPSTDVVTIVARTPDPETSQALANAYLDVYIESLRAQVSQTQQSEMDDLDASIDEVRSQLQQIDQRLQNAILPYLNRDPVPDVSTIEPGLVTDKEILRAQYDRLDQARAELEHARLNVATQIIQRATLPTIPVADPPNTLVVVGVVGGMFAGLVGAVVLARISPTVLGDLQAEDILGRPVVGSIPKVPSLRDRRTLLEPLPTEAREAIDSICVRAEAAEHGLTLTIVVTGPRRGSGATTVAAAMARRFADEGASVLLVDANRNHQELIRLFGSQPGAATLRVIDVDALVASGPVGLIPVDDVVEAASRQAEVVIVDAGALLETGTALRLARRADALVLTMPTRQRVGPLSTAATELRSHSTLLPVWTPAHGTRRGRPSFPLRSRTRHDDHDDRRGEGDGDPTARDAVVDGRPPVDARP